MDIDFWKQRWVEGQIGFHQGETNPYLIKHWPAKQIGEGFVLVPLCGKSLDMLWLRDQGYQVAGIELSDIAIKDFLAENGLKANAVTTTDFNIYQSDTISLYQGDFFNFKAEADQCVAAVYDRASLIALPPEMRQQYAQHLAELVRPGTPVLLVTMEYDQKEMSGPPFSVPESEVRALYQSCFEIEVIEEVDILAQQPQFRERGLGHLVERIYRMVRV